jgi:hypothetical protein
MLKKNDSYAKYTTLGFTVVFSVLLFWYGGKKLDEYLGYKSLFQLIGIFLAIIGIFLKLFYTVKEINENSDNKR